MQSNILLIQNVIDSRLGFIDHNGRMCFFLLSLSLCWIAESRQCLSLVTLRKRAFDTRRHVEIKIKCESCVKFTSFTLYLG